MVGKAMFGVGQGNGNAEPIARLVFERRCWFVVFVQKNSKMKARRNHDFSAAVACSFVI